MYFATFAAWTGSVRNVSDTNVPRECPTRYTCSTPNSASVASTTRGEPGRVAGDVHAGAVVLEHHDAVGRVAVGHEAHLLRLVLLRRSGEAVHEHDRQRHVVGERRKRIDAVRIPDRFGRGGDGRRHLRRGASCPSVVAPPSWAHPSARRRSLADRSRASRSCRRSRRPTSSRPPATPIAATARRAALVLTAWLSTRSRNDTTASRNLSREASSSWIRWPAPSMTSTSASADRSAK